MSDLDMFKIFREICNLLRDMFKRFKDIFK